MSAEGAAALSCRPAGDADLTALTALRHDFFASQIEAGLLDLPLNVRDAVEKSTPPMLANRRATLFVASDAGGLAGYIYGLTKIVPGAAKPSVSSVEELFVRRDRRGQGVAENLLAAALADMKARNPDRIQARVLDQNAPARRFWQGQGFEPNVLILEYSK